MQSPISMLTVILLSAIFAFAFSRHHHHHKHHHSNRINTDGSLQSSIPISYLPKVCPQASKSAEKWEFCPKPQSGNVVDWPCVRFSDLCNGLEDCPGGSDEDPEICFFHNLMRHELSSLRKTIDTQNEQVFGSTRKTVKTEKSSQTTSNEWVELTQL
ncbi:unnamed protein product, partial [Mesorhabditis belari]|uniref:Uncharacterized protein n=1 Tax=Mesorhabditis belari TaxID=2138241 RepID=A0AAF3ENN5_9BILA